MKKNNPKIKNAQAKSAPAINIDEIRFYLLLSFSVLILPLLYAKTALDPSLMLRLLALDVILLGAVVFELVKPTFTPHSFSVLRHWIFAGLLAYFLITLASMLLAINPRESFFDIAKTFAIFLLTAYSAIVFIQTPDWHNKLPKFVIVSALISCTIGFYQYYDRVMMNTIKFLENGEPTIYLVKGLMAHKNIFAISLMLMLPFTGYGIYKYRKGWRLASILASVLIIVIIIMLQTRSVWVGFFISAGVFTVMLTVLGKKFNVQPKVRLILLTAMVAGFLAISSLMLFGNKNTENPYLRRLLSITSTDVFDSGFRLKIWAISTKMIADKPITGIGAGNWKIKSVEYYKDFDFTKDQLNWIRPHNDFLWVFTEKGIFGFLLFLGLFGLTIFYMFSIFLSSAKTEYKIFTLFMMAGLASYLTDSLFSFPLERIEIQVYLSMIMASTVAIYHLNCQQKPLKINQNLAFTPVVIILLLSVAYSFSALSLEFKVRKARNAHSRSDWQGMLAEAKTMSTFFRNMDAESMPVEWYSGLAYASLNDLENAKIHYLKAHQANPTKIAILNNLGQIYFKQENFDEAKVWFLKALAILPDYFESNVNLSSTYIKLGDYENALKTLNTIPKNKRDERIQKIMVSVEKKLQQKEE
jgi:tetratricopeptide (TPR) repeat protein